MEQAGRTRAVLESVRDWNKEFDYRPMWNDRQIVTASAADIFTQMALHEVHHRAQAMNMLRQLGVKLEDIDFNALMLKRARRHKESAFHARRHAPAEGEA